MDERARRLWAGTEAGAIGYGGSARLDEAEAIQATYEKLAEAHGYRTCKERK